MASQFPHEDVTASLFVHWDDQFPLPVATIYPGTRVNTAALDEWIELWIDTWSRRPQRASAKELIDVSVTAHCFVKQGLDKSRVQELADAVRATISQKTIAVRDYDTSGSTVVGYATIFEAETRELTRNNLNSLQHSMQHLVVSCRGIAQEI